LASLTCLGLSPTLARGFFGPAVETGLARATIGKGGACHQSRRAVWYVDEVARRAPQTPTGRRWLTHVLSKFALADMLLVLAGHVGNMTLRPFFTLYC